MKPTKTSALKGKKLAQAEPENKAPHNDLLMSEILAMGGSEQDLELINGVDSGSEIEGDESDSGDEKINEQVKTKAKNSKAIGKKNSGASEQLEEPGLKNEVASFMKSLFGSALIDSQKMDQAAVEEEDEQEEAVDSSDGSQSQGSWETDQDGEGADSGADSGDDSMDDLPQELKDIAAQLNDKKRKADDVPSATSASKLAKKNKKEPVAVATPKSSPKNNDLKKVQKKVSAILAQPGKKTIKTKETPVATKPKATGKLATKSKPKLQAASKKVISKKSASKKPAWKLGDGWSKALEDE